MKTGFDQVALPVCTKKNGSDVVEFYNFNRYQISYYRKYNEKGKIATKTALFVVGNDRPFVINIPPPTLENLLREGNPE